jgi:hypothetical protein
MKCALATVLFVTFLSLVTACVAQQSHIPFAQLELEARNTPIAEPSATTTVAYSSSNSVAEAPTPAEPASFETVRTPDASKRHHFDTGLLVINSLHIGAAALDIALTKHCIDNHTCREGNPLMPSNVGGQIGVDLALVSYSSFVSYKLKKHNSKVWWLSPALGTSTHIAGIASGLSH